MIYAAPGTADSVVTFKKRYDNFINGQWVAPVKGQYFDNVTPVTGRVFCQVARSSEEDVNLALDAAHAAFATWGRTSPTERALLLNRVADRLEANLELLAVAISYDPPAYVMQFAQSRQLPFRVAIDHDGKIAQGFGDVQLTPTTFVIDRRGRIVKRYVGEPDFVALRALIGELLAQPAAA